MIPLKREEPTRLGESCRLSMKKSIYIKRLFASLQVLIYLRIVTGV